MLVQSKSPKSLQYLIFLTIVLFSLLVVTNLKSQTPTDFKKHHHFIKLSHSR